MKHGKESQSEAIATMKKHRIDAGGMVKMMKTGSRGVSKKSSNKSKKGY